MLYPVSEIVQLLIGNFDLSQSSANLLAFVEHHATRNADAATAPVVPPGYQTPLIP